mmetsp:Transcript_2601/g.2711  ORF Transcript_2601/g.2711 Transcript_2601/m.2711 type:complete len:461 (-) Transcript_2601:17-1399(-)
MSSFTGRDLALLLPDKIDLNYGEGEEDHYKKLEPKVDLSKKVGRYFPGKTPNWAKGEEYQNEYDRLEPTLSSSQQPVVEDRRLARLKDVTINREDNGSRRRVFEAEVVEDDSDFEEFLRDKDDNEDKDDYVEDNQDRGGRRPIIAEEIEEEGGEDEVADRRARIMKRLADKQIEEEVAIEESGESESEYETDTDEEEEDDDVKMKPIFIPKNKRATIMDLEIKAEELKLKDQKKMIMEEDRKRQTRVMVAESIRRADESGQMSLTDVDDDTGLPDDTDEIEPEIEYESWKVREMARLMRDAEIREYAALEKADLERRRLMTDDMRIAEDKRLGVGKFAADEKGKNSMRFMQKYYHKGVFYMDEDSTKAEGDVRNKKFNEPTLDDNFNKEQLPTVLQVKNFGKRGRTKYTHLMDQDTTKFNERLQVDENLQHKYLQKVGGVGSLDYAGKLYKRPKQDDYSH